MPTTVAHDHHRYQLPPLFSTGLIADVFVGQLTSAIPNWSTTVGTVLDLLTAGLIITIGGVTVWRAVLYAFVHDRTAPSGWLAGLWLGIGLAVGELANRGATGGGWLLPYPETLLVGAPDRVEREGTQDAADPAQAQHRSQIVDLGQGVPRPGVERTHADRLRLMPTSRPPSCATPSRHASTPPCPGQRPTASAPTGCATPP
jgi:hypothetical protein